MIAANGDEKVDLESTLTHIKLRQLCKVHLVRHNLLYL